MRIATSYGYYDLDPLPGNPQVCVSNHLMTYKHARGKGEGAARCKQRMAYAKSLGYKFIIATVHEDNVPEKTILAGNCWTMMHEFKNHDGHFIEVWGCTLE